MYDSARVKGFICLSLVVCVIAFVLLMVSHNRLDTINEMKANQEKQVEELKKLREMKRQAIKNIQKMTEDFPQSFDNQGEQHELFRVLENVASAPNKQHLSMDMIAALDMIDLPQDADRPFKVDVYKRKIRGNWQRDFGVSIP